MTLSIPVLFRQAFFSLGSKSFPGVATYGGCSSSAGSLATARLAEPESCRTNLDASEKFTSMFSLSRHSLTSSLNDVHVAGSPFQEGILDCSSCLLSLILMRLSAEYGDQKPEERGYGGLP